ncbi:choice-of-anchor L domain-containing protein [Marivita sp. GX14005]|uniref:Hint domain-containing protein n=1 Tax=Marivita sp. GX14005 TaxID=2942276 RepID=UPI0020186D0F|nr:choice-of-anchor L domain-containing protein [Marivita sp. GX14005]MCL3882869.1 Hint domain-containing protein [Marivita sp. GX14005]
MPIAQELPINTSASALDMANTIFGAGITVNSASYTGDSRSSGVYTNGDSVSPDLTPGDTGVILSTGRAEDVTNDPRWWQPSNTNFRGNTSTNTSGTGDSDFTAIAGASTFDASFLEVTFTPNGNTLTLDFVIASEEYPEYISSQFLDVVGIWVNGTQATVNVGSGQVSVGNINGNTANNLYRDNTNDQYNTEMDGFTVTLSVVAPVNAGVQNTIKIGIADVQDSNYDSNLLIAGGSAQSSLVADDDTLNIGLNSTKIVDVLANDSTTAGTMTITQINGIAVVAGDSVTLTSGQVVTLNPDGTLSVQSDGDTETAYFNYTVENGLGNSDTGVVQVTQMPCFVAGTLIDTPRGPVAVETLRPGDLVLTLDDGAMPVRWAGARETVAEGRFAPILISAGSFGAERDVLLSPQHRVLIRDIWAELLFGEAEVLIKARDLVNGCTVRQVTTGAPVTYVHLLFDRHEILTSSGLASESYLPGPMMAQSFDAEAQAEIITLFPELADHAARNWTAARPILKSHEARALQARAA